MIKKLLFASSLLFLAGCSHKSNKEFKTDLQLHQHIKKDLGDAFFDKADNDFMSLEADYPGSHYIKSDLLALYLAHLENKDYILAKFYLNQYEKRFASINEIPWCEYKKIKIEFLKYQNAYTNQDEILNILNMCENYIQNYPKSEFLPEVNTIYTKVHLTNKYLDKKISKLYKRLDKPKAAKFYNTKIPKSAKEPVIPWYKKLFYW